MQRLTARLCYEVVGSGHPLILIHGATLDARMWDDQVEAFSQRYRVVRLDVRGHGQSAPPSGKPYSRSEDLKALLDHLGLAHAHVLGLSMGGSVAIDFALSHPEATRALILVDTGLGGFQRSPEFGAWIEAIRATARHSGIQAAREFFLKHPLFAPALERPGLAARLGRMMADYSGWHWVNEDPLRPVDPPAVERLERISAPTLVIVGERDLPDFHAIAEALHRRIPGARKVVMPGVGHLPNMEDPQRFNAIVLEFLASL